MDLKIVVIIKREIIQGDNHVNEVTKCASRNGVMRGST